MTEQEKTELLPKLEKLIGIKFNVLEGLPCAAAIISGDQIVIWDKDRIYEGRFNLDFHLCGGFRV